MSKPLGLLDQFAQLRQQRSAVVVLLFLLVVVVFWVGVSLFSSQQKFAVPKEMRDLAKPLSPIVDESVFTLIEQRQAYPEAELQDFTIYKVIVNDLTKQLRLVDINYQETPLASKSAVALPEISLDPTPTVTDAPTPASSSSGVEPTLPAAP